jgi:hypothetical protein
MAATNGELRARDVGGNTPVLHNCGMNEEYGIRV